MPTIHNQRAHQAIMEHPDVLVIAVGDDVMTPRVVDGIYEAADAFRLTVVVFDEPPKGASVIGDVQGAPLTFDGAVVWVAAESPPAGLLRALVHVTWPKGKPQAVAFTPAGDLEPVVTLVGNDPTAVSELAALDDKGAVLAACWIELSGDPDESDADITVDGARDLAALLEDLASAIREAQPHR